MELSSRNLKIYAFKDFGYVGKMLLPRTPARKI